MDAACAAGLRIQQRCSCDLSSVFGLCKLCTAPGLLRPDSVGMWTVLGLLFGVFPLAWIAWVAAPKPPPARYRRRDRRRDLACGHAAQLQSPPPLGDAPLGARQLHQRSTAAPSTTACGPAA